MAHFVKTEIQISLKTGRLCEILKALILEHNLASGCYFFDNFDNDLIFDFVRNIIPGTFAKASRRVLHYDTQNGAKKSTAMTTYVKYKAILVLLISLFFSPDRVVGQKVSKPKTAFEYITLVEGSQITLETDLTTILETRYSSDYYPAKLTLSDGKYFLVKVQPKGKYRRKTAEVPPLKIKFPKKTLVEMGLDTLNEVRLMLPSVDNYRGDRLLAKEYLTYRMFEHLTNNCVRARLVKVNLRDNHVETSSKEMYGMLVEDNEETAARLNGTEVEQYGLPFDSMVTEQAALVAMFQYMIGNTDWDAAMLRNVRLIRPRGAEKIILTPYDFDFSGLVAAPYASPSSESGLRTVRDRFLMATGLPKSALRQATQVLKNAEKELTDICYNKLVPRETSSEMMQYLESFFRSIDKSYDVPVRAVMTTTD